MNRVIGGVPVERRRKITDNCEGAIIYVDLQSTHRREFSKFLEAVVHKTEVNSDNINKQHQKKPKTRNHTLIPL